MSNTYGVAPTKEYYIKNNILHANNPKANYSLKNMVDDLTPYTQLPPEEISRLIKLLFFFILYNIILGKIVQVYKFGQFDKKFYKGGKYRSTKTNVVEDTPDRWVCRFTPYPMIRWLLAPDIRTSSTLYKIPWYYRFLHKVKEELWFHTDKYNVDAITPPFKNDKIKQEYLELCKKKPRRFNQQR
jgi:nucleoid DNA-binding protein